MHVRLIIMIDTSPPSTNRQKNGKLYLAQICKLQKHTPPKRAHLHMPPLKKKKKRLSSKLPVLPKLCPTLQLLIRSNKIRPFLLDPFHPLLNFLSPHSLLKIRQCPMVRRRFRGLKNFPFSAITKQPFLRKREKIVLKWKPI